MSSYQHSKYSFVFHHLSKIDETPSGSSVDKNEKLLRNQSSHNLEFQSSTFSLPETQSLPKSISTPNLLIPTSVNTNARLNQASGGKLIMHENSQISQMGVNIYSKKVQTLQQQTALCKNLMTSNQKKAYQYYFKKTESSDGRESWPRVTPDVKTQTYIKYERYPKLTSSNHNSSSATKDLSNNRGSVPFALERHGSIQLPNNATDKMFLQRQPSIENKTQKQPYKFVTPNMSPITNRHHAKSTLYTDRVMEFVQPDFSANNRIQQTLAETQVERKHNQNLKNPQSINSNHKSRQFQQFLNQTMGENLLISQKTNGQNVQNIKNIKNLSAISYLDEIEKIKNKLKHSQVTQETVVKVEDKILPIQRDETVAESATGEGVSMCLDCEQLKKDLERARAQCEQTEKKRQANMDQIFRQQKTIKQMQESEAKSKTQLGLKVANLALKQKQVSQLTSTVQTLVKSSTQTNASFTSLKVQFSSRLSAQLSRAQAEFRQQLQTVTQKISAHVLTINNQKKKLEEMQENNRQNHKQMRLEYERQMEGMRELHREEVEKIRKENGQEVSRVRDGLRHEKQAVVKSYVEREKKLVESQEHQIQEFEQKHLSTISALKLEHSAQKQRTVASNLVQKQGLMDKIKQLQSGAGQVWELTETIVKLESQILQEKSATYSCQKELNACKVDVQNAKKELVLEKEQGKVIKQEKQKLEAWFETLKQEKLSLEAQIKSLKLQIASSNQQLGKASQTLFQTMEKNTQLQNSLTSLQKQTAFLECISSLFKMYLEPKEYEKLTVNVRSLINQGMPMNELVDRVMGQNKSMFPSVQPQNVSVSPSTSSHPKSCMTLKQKESQTLANKLNQATTQLNQLSAKNVQIVKELQQKHDKELQQKHDTLVMKDKLINSLQHSVKAGEKLIFQLSEENLELTQKTVALGENVSDKTMQIEHLLASVKLYEQSIQQKQALVSDLNNKTVDLGQFIDNQPTTTKQTNADNTKPDHQYKSASSSHQSTLQPPIPSHILHQLQSREQQINELSTQLQESFEIIKVLKCELEEREQQFALYQKQHEWYQQQNRAKSASEGSQNQQAEGRYASAQPRQMEYLDKIQHYYNEVLQIFGLEQVSFQLIHQNPHLQQNNTAATNSKLPHRSDSLNSEQSAPDNQENPHTNEQLTPLHSSGSLPEPQQTPFEHLLTFLSHNQQEVLHIINQWIRKLERQSLSIHQNKEKLHHFDRQLKDLQHANALLDRQKLQICEKYESFITKLERQHARLDEKASEMGLKITELQVYIKELEELVESTNKQCMKNGLYSLQLAKEHNVGGMRALYLSQKDSIKKQKNKLHKELLMEGGKSVTHHTCLQYLDRLLLQECGQKKQAKSYWQSFYETHAKVNHTQQQSQIQLTPNQQINRTQQHSRIQLTPNQLIIPQTLIEITETQSKAIDTSAVEAITEQAVLTQNGTQLIVADEISTKGQLFELSIG